MKVLITGPDGLLGSNVVRVFLERGYEVRTFQLPNSPSKTLEGLPIERFYGNLLKAEDVLAAVAGCELVVHAGANTSVWPIRSALIRDVNIIGTQHIIDACLAQKVKRLIHVSSAASFHFGTKEQPATECNPFTGDMYGLDYIDSKYKAHQMVEQAVKEQGLPAVIICPTFMFGPYDSKPSAGEMILSMYAGKIPGYAPGGKNFVHVRDVAVAIANAVDKGRIGESYIAGHQNLNYREIFQKIAQVTGARPPRLGMPGPLIKAFGRATLFFAHIFKFRPGLTYPLAHISTHGQYFTAAKAVKELDMPQTPVEEAIKEAFDWLKANGYVKK